MAGTPLSSAIQTYLENTKVSDLRVMSRTDADGNSVSYESLERLQAAQLTALNAESTNDAFFGPMMIV
jgi:hypothetical protein